MAVAEEIIEVSSVAGEEVTQEVPSLTEELRLYYQTALGKTGDELKADLDAGMFPHIKFELDNKVAEQEKAHDQSFIDFVLATQPDIEAASKFIESELQGNVFTTHLAPDIAAILADSESSSKLDKQLIERSIAAQRIIDRHAQQYEGGWMSTAGSFADAVVSEGIQNVLGGATGSDVFESAWQLRDLAKQAGQLLYMNLPKEDFEREFEAIISRVEDMGLLSDANPFFFTQFVDMIREGGAGATTNTATAFGTLDVLLAPLSVPFATMKGGVRGVPKVLTQVAGSEKAASVTLQEAATNPNSMLVVGNTAPAFMTPGRLGESLLSAPDLSVMRQMEAGNAALNLVKQSNFGNYVDEEILQANYIKFLKETQDRLPDYPRQEINYEIRTDDLGNIFGGVILGRRSNSTTTAVQPYSTLASAQRLADAVGGEVLETLDNGVTKYVVRKEVAIPTAGLTDTTDTAQIATGMFSGLMSTTARTTVNLDGRIKQAEAQIARTLSLVNTNFNKVARKVGVEDKMKVDNFFRSLRDDPLYNGRTEAMPVQEFEVEFTTRYGTAPSQEVKDYYTALTEINDVDYYLTADKLLKDAVNNGEEMVRVNQNFYRSKKVEGLEDTTAVYDPELGRWRVASDYNERAVFYELNDFPVLSPESGPVRYAVLDSPTTRRLYHTDVMPYNVGGHRAREGTINFYLKQENEFTLGSGQAVTGKPRTFMGVRLEDEANTAVKQINTVVEEIRRVVGQVPVGQYRAFLTGNRQLDALVKANNTWNSSVESIEDFVQFFEDYNLDITKLVNFAGDGEPLVGQGFASNATIGGHFRTTNLAKGRGMKPLTAFGGHELESVDPTSAIQRGFTQSISRYGNQAYLHNAISGWLKAAKETGALQNAADLATTTNPRQAFENAVVSSKTAAGKALEKERATIRFRMNQKTRDVVWYQTNVKNMADFVYGKGNKKATNILDWLASSDPTQFFRAMAFQLKMGLFALPQLYVQASQMVNIVGIVGPRIGMQAGLGVMPLRMALVEGIPQAALQRLASIQAAATGLDPKEFIELVDWVKKSGRNVIDQTVIEENNSFTFYKPGIGRAVLNKGLIPFREGELAARLMAAVANRLELKQSGAVVDIFSDSMTRRMLHRQDVLTASMTSASSAPWQKSMAALPLQFMTYNVRMMEQIFTDRILTGPERVRLGLTHMITYGAAGVPVAGWLSDKLSYEHGITVDTPSYEMARYGVLDTVLSLLTGEDTALSTRLAAGEGLTDFFRNIFSGDTPFVEVISGPGGSVTADVFGSMLAFGKNIFSGNWDHTSYDWNRLGRNISSYEMGYRLWVGRKTGEYISRRTQDVLMEDLSAVDSLLLAAGVPLKQIDYMWNTIEFEKKEKKNLEQHATEARRLNNIAIQYIQDGNYAAANEIAKDVGAMRQMLQPYEQEVFDRRVWRDQTVFDSLIKRAIEHGKPEVAEALQNYMRN